MTQRFLEPFATSLVVAFSQLPLFREAAKRKMGISNGKPLAMLPRQASHPIKDQRHRSMNAERSDLHREQVRRAFEHRRPCDINPLIVSGVPRGATHRKSFVAHHRRSTNAHRTDTTTTSTELTEHVDAARDQLLRLARSDSSPQGLRSTGRSALRVRDGPFGLLWRETREMPDSVSNYGIFSTGLETFDRVCLPRGGVHAADVWPGRRLPVTLESGDTAEPLIRVDRSTPLEPVAGARRKGTRNDARAS